MEFLQILITVHNNLFVLWPPQWRSAVLPRLAAPSENGRIRMEQNNLQYNEGQFADRVYSTKVVFMLIWVRSCTTKTRNRQQTFMMQSNWKILSIVNC